VKWVFALPVMLAFSACGYHVAGRADLMPKDIRTIAIPAFGNVTMRYDLARRLPADITHEFISRTRYQIVADPNAADAVLTGYVVSFSAYPTVSDPVTNRSTGVQAAVILSLTLTERSTGKVLFNRQNADFRERYEISVDPRNYFDESSTALERLSRDVARSVVSAVLENF
jgi:hypothetical protein